MFYKRSSGDKRSGELMGLYIGKLQQVKEMFSFKRLARLWCQSLTEMEFFYKQNLRGGILGETHS